MLASASRRISSALLLFSTIGIDDVISRSVTQRAPGIGIWTALGASRGTVLWLILRHGLLLPDHGRVPGTGGALVLSQLLSSLLFGVGGRDAPTLTAVAGILGLVAVLACLFPARRATKVDPLVALHYE